MLLRHASELNGQNLYHYQSVRTSEDKKRLARILSSNTVFCSNPTDFNDPWDCKPCYDTVCLSDPTRYEQHVKYFMDIDYKHNELPRHEHLLREKRLREDKLFLEGLVHQMGDAMSAGFSEKYRVYCLTTKPNCTLMWSHYAGNHRGICLEFSGENPIFGTAFKVEYRESFPIMALDDEQDLGRVLMPLFVKSNAWQYEDEYRIVAQERSKSDGENTLMVDKGFLRFHPKALIGIIVGCMMPESEIEYVSKLIKKYAPHVVLKRATRVPNKYELVIQ